MKKSNLTVIMSVIIITLFLITGYAFGDEALYVAPDGKVGIGTMEPDAKLNVQNGTDVEPGLSYPGFIVIGDLQSYNIGIDNNEIMARVDGSTSPLYIQNDGGNTLLNHNGGKVGIGITSPQQLLHIHNSDSSNYSNAATLYTNVDSGTTTSDGFYVGISSYGIGNAWIWNRENAKLLFGTNAQYRMTILGNGNVGIGTTSPSYGLHVYENNSDVAVYARNEKSSGLSIALEGLAYGGGSNYGIYTQAYGGTSNYAAYFNGYVYCTYIIAADKFVDYTPFYEGDALSEIAKISGKDGEIDHSTLPEFAHSTQEVPVFEESELEEISPEDAFETVLVEQDKVVETTKENGTIVKSKIKKGIKTESKGYKVEDGKIVEIIEETPIYETETIKTTQLRKDVYFDERTSKVYQKTGNGEIFEKDGKVYQRNQTGTKVEEQRDIGAMVSILTVAVQQLDKENEELRKRIAILESKSK